VCLLEGGRIGWLVPRHVAELQIADDKLQFCEKSLEIIQHVMPRWFQWPIALGKLLVEGAKVVMEGVQPLGNLLRVYHPVCLQKRYHIN
jgi:hypothetical protein